MEKFLVGAVVGFFVCHWLTKHSNTTNKDGIHFLKEQVLPRPGTAMPALVSGLISQNRNL